MLRAIKMTIEAGHRHGIWVGICGELGADTALTETFLRMGVDELSMNAKSHPAGAQDHPKRGPEQAF